MHRFFRILYVTGFPHAGSTLLCQLLRVPETYSTGHSSLLSPLLMHSRQQWSDNEFLLLVQLQDIHRWLDLTPNPFDPNDLPVRLSEIDSHYRYKYPHRTFSRIQPPALHPVPARISQERETHFLSYYEAFYPGLLNERQKSTP